MKSWAGNGLLFMLCLMLITACSTNQTSQSTSGTVSTKPVITLNAVSFLPKDDPLTASINEWIKSVEKATNSQVRINWRGGSDVIPVGEQPNAVINGAVDIVFNHTGQYESQNLEVSALALSRLTPWEERESGFFNAMVESHKKINMVYLGRWLTGSPQIWLNNKVEKLNDLQGVKIRATANYTRFFQKIGITPLIINPSEVYTALQTGLVKGFVYGGMLGPRKNGWTDSSKFVLDHPFWNQNCAILMNTNKWASISKENQDAILKATTEYEHYMVDYYTKESEKEKEALKAMNVQFIKFSDQEAKTFVDTAYNVEWENLQTKLGEKTNELRKLTEKK
jgi:TRAP-type C4-dicarboxylate transport system substrate-binding protein